MYFNMATRFAQSSKSKRMKFGVSKQESHAKTQRRKEEGASFLCAFASLRERFSGMGA
jgi:hypothetical protein